MNKITRFEEHDQRAGRVPAYRWGFVALISLGTICNYLSRNSLGVLASQLEGLMHFGVKEYSYVVGAFQFAYTAMQPVCGFVLDRLGVRAGFALFAVLWSLISILHAAAGSWQVLALFRGLLGASEAAAVPAGMKGISEWFGGRDRSKAVGWFNAGTSLGAMFAPPLTVALTLAYGWQSAFVVTGLLGLVWAGLWFGLYRSPAGLRRTRGLSLGQGVGLLGLRRFWAVAIPRFLAEPAWQTFSFWIPLYLSTERHWDLKQIALFAWLPFLAADFGGVLGGYLSPLLMRVGRLNLLPARVATTAIGAVLMIGPGCVALAGNAYGAIALFCIGGFAHQMISVTINTLSADLFSSHELGTANGWVGCAGWTGGLLFSLLIGQVVETTGYGPLFACLGVFDIIGAVALFVLLRGMRPVEDPV
jgi:ACS family hexuronate transporter-like MFS transporter